MERVFKMCYESRERSWEPLSVLLPDSGEEHGRQCRIHSRIGVSTYSGCFLKFFIIFSEEKIALIQLNTPLDKNVAVFQTLWSRG